LIVFDIFLIVMEHIIKTKWRQKMFVVIEI